MNVIDRSSGKVAILEGPEALFLHFRRLQLATGIDPGGNDACDFEIDKRTRKGLTVYRVTYDARRPTPFTAAERLLLRKEVIDLTSVFRPTPHAELEVRLGLRAAE